MSNKPLRMVILFLLLLGFWLVLSARLDPLFVVIGAATAAWVAWYTLQIIDHEVADRGDDRAGFNPIALVVYVVWLFARQIASAFALAWIILHPRLAPRPGVVRFRTGLSTPAARTMLATSITLVPGTNTIEVEDDQFTVHAFTAASAGDLASAKLQRRIAAVFRLPPDDPPQMIWEPLSEGTDAPGEEAGSV